MDKNSSRYHIEGFYVIDSKRPQTRIYIRDVIDVGSHEYSSSKLSAQEKLDIISGLGVVVLTEVLDACYRSSGKLYDASNNVDLAVMRQTLPLVA